VALARYFSARRERMHRWGTFIAGMALVLLPLTLVLLQPDLGTAIVFGALFLVLAWSGGAPARMLLTTAITALLAVPAAWPFLHAYQRQRILVFLDPSNRDPLTNGYNLLQAQIAIGSGGVSGKGFLLGTQGHLRFLPAPTTDFIFAVFSEEFGFIGAGVLLFLFSWLIWRLVRGSSLARDDFGGLLLMGVAGMFFFQAAVNVGMNLGVLPVVGIPLPFMSFGGSAMVTNLAAIGIAQSVLIRRKPVRF
jgi:rod shape determining protein RodA